ncbi:MAG: DUF6320 domain-containing protein [Oscillospiraceae bacterium]|nr:DUF6320 domain-containing protein [Oscillospiraceae bacterium]
MSYCVNCGVRLEDSEERCPLCGVEVINPAAEPLSKRSYPYPRRIETINRKLDKRIFTFVALMASLIPAAITLFYDAVGVGGGLSWSLYVVGALALALVVVLVPVNFPKLSAAVCLALDFAAATGYVWLIEHLAGGSWFLQLGLPICLSAAVAAITIALLCESGRVSGLLGTLALCLFITGLLALALEIIIDLWALGSLGLNWSVYVALPCALLAVIALLLRRRQRLKDEIRRRFYV